MSIRTTFSYNMFQYEDFSYSRDKKIGFTRTIHSFFWLFLIHDDVIKKKYWLASVFQGGQPDFFMKSTHIDTSLTKKSQCPPLVPTFFCCLLPDYYSNGD